MLRIQHPDFLKIISTLSLRFISHAFKNKKTLNTHGSPDQFLCKGVYKDIYNVVYIQLSSKPLSLTEGIFFHTWYDWSSSSRAFSQLFLILSLRDNEIFEVWLLNSSLQRHCDDWLCDKLPLLLWDWESTLLVTEPEINKKEWVIISLQVLKLF